MDDGSVTAMNAISKNQKRKYKNGEGGFQTHALKEYNNTGLNVDGSVTAMNAISMNEKRKYKNGEGGFQTHALNELTAAGYNDGSVTAMNAISMNEKHKYEQGKNGLNKVNDASAKRDAENGVRPATAGNIVQVCCSNSKCSKREQRDTTQMISWEDAHKGLTKSAGHAAFEVRSFDKTLLHTHTTGGNFYEALIAFLAEQHGCTTDEMKEYCTSRPTVYRKLGNPEGGDVTVDLSADTKHKYWIKKLEPTPFLAIMWSRNDTSQPS